MMGPVIDPEGARARKTELRARLSAARRGRDDDQRAAAARAITAAVLELPEVRAARTVTAYVARASEPGTTQLLHELTTRGVRVLLPVLIEGLVLDWAEYTGDGALVPCTLPGNSALLEPTGRRLGADAVAGVDVVLAPGLAVGADGVRMGFGGGCYDKALALADPATPVVVLLYDDEVLAEVPTEPHDRAVTAAVTPSRVVRFKDTRAQAGDQR
jgi:5-formyltetrahydrofolate cyclo-ligase